MQHKEGVVRPWWMSPWWVAAGAVVPAGLMLHGVRVPGGYFSTLSAAMWCWVIVATAWLTTGVMWWAGSPPGPRRRLSPLAVVPMVFAATWSLASGDLPGKATFTYYRADLERHADQTSGYGATEVGPYRFQSVIRTSGCVLLYVRGPGMAEASGFARCPGGTPTTSRWSEGEIFELIEGDWYAFLAPYGPGVFDTRGPTTQPWGLQLSELRPMPDV